MNLSIVIILFLFWYIFNDAKFKWLYSFVLLFLLLNLINGSILVLVKWIPMSQQYTKAIADCASWINIRINKLLRFTFHRYIKICRDLRHKLGQNHGIQNHIMRWITNPKPLYLGSSFSFLIFILPDRLSYDSLSVWRALALQKQIWIHSLCKNLQKPLWNQIEIQY